MNFFRNFGVLGGRKGDLGVKTIFSGDLPESRHMTPHFASFCFKILKLQHFWKNSKNFGVLVGKKRDLGVKTTFSEYLPEYRHMTPHFASSYFKISNLEDYRKKSVKWGVYDVERGIWG